MQLPTNYDLYIFDMDGTLVDSLPQWFGIFKKFSNIFGYDSSDKAVVNVAFHDHDRLNKLLKPDKRIYLDKMILSIFSTKGLLKFFPGADAALAQISISSKKIALCTSSHKKTLDVISGLTELSKFHFDQIVTGDTLKHQKPDPEGVNRILGALNVSPSRTLYVGDSYPDLLTSQNAGIDFLWMDFPTNRPYILDSHYEVLKQQSKYRLTSYT